MNARTIRALAATALLTWSAAAAADVPPPVLPAGVSDAQSMSGIYAGTNDGDCCWLSDEGAVHVSPPADARALAMEVFIPQFALSKGPQRLTVAIGTNDAQESPQLTAGEHELLFALPQHPAPATLDIAITPAYSFVPAELGMNQDPRHLSVLVRAIRFYTDAAGLQLPPLAPPLIVGVHLDKTSFRSGDDVSGVVTTSSNVVKVEARVANVAISVPKTADGRFTLRYAIPRLAVFLKGHYNLIVTALNIGGAADKRVIPITLR